MGLLVSAPHRDQGGCPLELPRGFPDEEGFLDFTEEGEVGAQMLFQPRQCTMEWPECGGSEVLQPRARRRQNKLSIRFHE